MIESKILTQYSPINALHLHPRHYTCLIQLEQDLYYYDCFSSIQLWSYKIQQQLMLAFSLDFDKVYALQNKQIVTISNGTHTKLCPTTIENPDSFILHDLYYIFVKKDDIFVQSREGNDMMVMKLPWSYGRILMLEQKSKSGQLCWIGIMNNKIQFIKIDLEKMESRAVSEYVIEEQQIQLCKVNEINKSISIIVGKKIIILSYKTQTLKLKSSSNYDRPIQDIAFFTFAQNTDSVGGKYKIQHLLILCNASDTVDLLQLNTGVVKWSHTLSSPVSHIYFNRLFNNSFITLSPTGEVSRINLFGYNKEWVCLGYRFVEIESNQVYEEKEDDFEVSNKKKKKVVKIEELDDSSLTLFSPDEMLEGKVKRISFNF